jgi:DNA repair protein RecO
MITGIILYTSPYLEKSKILQVYTPSGLKSIILNKERSQRFVTGDEILNQISFNVKDDKSMSSITEFTLENDFSDIKHDLDRLRFMIMICDFTRLILDNTHAADIYSALLHTFLSKDYIVGSINYIFKGFEKQGVCPDFMSILNSEDITGLSYTGDLLHKPNLPTTSDLDYDNLILLLSIFLEKPIQLEEQGKPILRFINNYIDHHFGVKLISLNNLI